MDADDLQQLYKLLRGSRTALMVLDAHGHFVDHQMRASHRVLSDARELFAESRARTLKQDAAKEVDAKAKDANRQIKRLQRKQDKAREVLETFDELVPQLKKLAQREQQHHDKTNVPSHDSDVTEPQHRDATLGSTDVSGSSDEFLRAKASAVTSEFIDAMRQTDGDDQLDLVARHFGFRKVKSIDDIHDSAVYFIRRRGRSFVIETLGDGHSGDDIPVINLLSDKPMKPISPRSLIKLGQKRKMVLLTVKQGGQTQPNPNGDDGDGDGEDQQSSEEVDQHVLDLGAFSQLMTSAQRCGMVPGADQIGHVRDREFRMGQYHNAFQTIGSLHSHFTSNSLQRTQRLTREDADIASGRVRMSPKDLQAKRARDRVQSQEIERARRRFQVVVEGLRVLMNASDE